jgi:hypothetical protein
MKEETISDAVLREFLLGGLADDERARIESKFLTDPQAKETILAAEQDLIDDYLEDSLTTADKERFVALYARTSEQRRRLRITKSIKNWASTEGALPEEIPAGVSSWARLRNWLRLRPAVVPVAIALVVALVVVAVWLNRRVEQRNRRAAIEQELAQLNSPESMRGRPERMVPMELSPVIGRDIDKPKVLNRESVEVVELVLPWTKGERYSKYRAEVRRVDDGDSFMTDVLQEGSEVIRLRVPTHILRQGNYRVELSGITPDGSLGASEEYSFSVRN